MTSKKKLVISLSIAAAVLVCAIVALVAVFAASTQTVQTAFKVTFTATDVDATVVATQRFGTTGDYTALGTATFNASDAGKTESLSPANLTLNNDDKKSYSIKYEFTNRSENDLVVTLSNSLYTGDSDNGFKITFADGEGAAVTASSLSTDGITVTKGAAKVIVLTVAIPDDVNSNAELNISLSFTLTNSAAPTT